ncbi:ATP-dependent zinc protease [Legionella londiniensis]|uniref:Secreted protein n=1 Tax=Legionella londiniensis TaxID=45068 RepID=A0A0W0VNP7_9GAMM|nr:RimK/LysX family protein [Legionella londiniensis]KTD21792.1 secreted protein [Legionella londiniensis]STX92168.1 secreted protein [Legionella londiniensis]
MRRIVSYFFFSLLLIGQAAMANSEKIVYGYIEKATLVEKNLTLPAKLDTGAKSASLNAVNIKEIEIDGKPYLNFIVPSKEGDIAFTAEYIGDVNIKVRAGEKLVYPVYRKAIKRPVVLMRLRLADKERAIQVNLTNRKRFIYPLLLGRDAIIAFNGIVDPSLKYTLNPKESSKP